MVDKFLFRKMKHKDLEFFLDIRNECSDFLHDNSKFTIEETTKWFINNNPIFYVIRYCDVDIGYFRTSNYLVDKKSMYIGCDLHKNWRGKKLSYNVYIKFMTYLFDEFDLDKISLEVLETNIVAYNLYEKLGFIEESEEIFIRKDKPMVSILMSISKVSFYKKYNIE